MASTEWWQRGPIENVPAVLQPVAHILLQVRESVGEMVEGLTEAEWNRRPGGVASAAFHVRHIAGVIDRLFTYARGEALSAEQLAAIPLEGSPLAAADVPGALETLSTRIDAALAELKTVDVDDTWRLSWCRTGAIAVDRHRMSRSRGGTCDASCRPVVGDGSYRAVGLSPLIAQPHR